MVRECKHCNSTFELTRKDKMFCSKSCKNKHFSHIYRLNNSQKISEYNKIYRQQNKEKLALQHKKWREDNVEYIKNKKKEWQTQFKEKHGVSHTSFRRQSDINERIKHNVRVRINKAINSVNRTGSAVNELGCSIEEFKIYISELFKEGMTWDNYGEWHIDHIKPLDSFDLTDPKQFKQACNYSNLQPLWKLDNLSKGSKNPFEV